MVAEAVLDATPGDRARAAADALGDRQLVIWCAALLGRRAQWGAPAWPDPAWLAGKAAQGWGAPERLSGERDYWARVWAARTLLYVWDDTATADLVAGLEDPAWRVREMCAKVCARWGIDDAADRSAVLVADETPRVRVAALRVLGASGEGEHVSAVRAALDDPDETVRTAADRALGRLADRLDRPVTE
ncbi:MAG: HEAT repeat domain-containing protein [Intrasporangium sp.]|uniref:HEAT repeat domain-containing protein n=1 Tax=Intrasporangium sp. TaxID=1925024 RepID=UPI003F8186B8